MPQVVVGIISRRNSDTREEYLLISSTKDFGKFTGYFYPPGGHIEVGENKQEALIREFREELGITVKPVGEIAQTAGDVENQITYWWNCETSDTNFVKSDEISKVGYFSKEAMSKLPLWPATKAFFNEYIFDGA